MVPGFPPGLRVTHCGVCHTDLHALGGSAEGRNAVPLGRAGRPGRLSVYPLAPPWLTDLGYADPIASSLVEPSARPVGSADEIAAMPSFHVGYLVEVAVAVFGVIDSVTPAPRWLRCERSEPRNPARRRCGIDATS